MQGYYNNTCILAAAGDPYLDISGSCDPSNHDNFAFTSGNNTIFAPDASVTVNVCGTSYNMADWLAVGADAGTTLSDMPSTPQIIAWASALLGIGSDAPAI